MASTLDPPIAPDAVLGFAIKPGTLLQFLAARTEGGPRLKCVEGSVTLVSPGRLHETWGGRLASLLLAVCLELKVKHTALHSTTWALPDGAEDTGYEADAAYYVPSYGTAEAGHPPDLAIEVVVTHPETQALRAGALLKIPELWVLHIPRHRLTFYHLATTGPHTGIYRPHPESRAFPVLTSAEVLERLDDPEPDDTTFHENCREWARHVLIPRREAGNREGQG